MTADRLFNGVAVKLLHSDPSIERGVMLHAGGLKTAGKFFAFASRGDLFLKLPAARVAELIDSGAGKPCEIRKGAPMREWVRVQPTTTRKCEAFVIEAKDFVDSLKTGPKKRR